MRQPLCRFCFPVWLPFLIFAQLAVIACGERQSLELQLPETSIISVRKNWVVVKYSYLPLYAEPTVDADIRWHARMGNVFEVMEQSLKTEFLYNEEEYWLFVSHGDVGGWVFGAGVESYSSREEALDAASRLDVGEGF